MKNKLLIIFSVIALGCVFIFTIGNNQTLPVITYFPQSENITFTTKKTKLQLNNDNKLLYWTSSSELEKPVYLRQDASLLFQNGVLRGVLSKWEQHVKSIELNEQLKVYEPTKFEAISAHYGEIHNKEKIYSAFAMSSQSLYLKQNLDELSLKSILKPYSTEDKSLILELDNQSKHSLNIHWDELIDHFHINKSEYTLIPLVDLATYSDKPLPTLSRQDTKVVIGKLWEGLYKNYVIQAFESKHTSKNNYMPLILLDKKNTHLIVIYELNGEKEQLIQRIQSN